MKIKLCFSVATFDSALNIQRALPHYMALCNHRLPAVCPTESVSADMKDGYFAHVNFIVCAIMQALELRQVIIRLHGSHLFTVIERIIAPD